MLKRFIEKLEAFESPVKAPPGRYVLAALERWPDKRTDGTLGGVVRCRRWIAEKPMPLQGSTTTDGWTVIEVFPVPVWERPDAGTGEPMKLHQQATP